MTLSLVLDDGTVVLWATKDSTPWRSLRWVAHVEAELEKKIVSYMPVPSFREEATVT